MKIGSIVLDCVNSGSRYLDKYLKQLSNYEVTSYSFMVVEDQHKIIDGMSNEVKFTITQLPGWIIS